MSDRDFSCGVVPKQPVEVKAAGDVYLDWVKDLGDGETITACVVTVRDEGGADVTASLASGAATIDGTCTSVGLVGGIDGEDYWVEHSVETSGGSTKVRGFVLQVREKDRP